MSHSNIVTSFSNRCLLSLPTALLCLLLSVLLANNAIGAATKNNAELVESGRRIYELGILPDKRPLRSTNASGFTLSGSNAACVTCHRRSGMGDIEGQAQRTILVPPLAGPVLFKPARFANSFLDPAHHYVPNKAWARSLTRPAYDDESLARALHQGVDSAGRPLSLPMMRYDLDAPAMAALSAYLHQLNTQPTPGLNANGLHLATVVTPDVPAQQAQSVLSVIRAWTRSMRPTGTAIVWHVWRLHGKASDWPRQLDAYYKKQAVFALISGVGTSHWQAVQDFCEARALPCVLPSVEVVPEQAQHHNPAKSAYYSVYYSTGVTLEARILANFLRQENKNSPKPTRLRQIYSDDSGRIAAQTLRQLLPDTAGEQLDRGVDASSLSTVFSQLTADDSVMLWLRPEQIETLIDAWDGPLPGRIFLSSLLFPPDSVVLPREWKRHVSYVSLYDDLGVQNEIARVRLTRWLRQHRLSTTELRLQADAYSACYLFNAALARIRSQEIRRPAVPLSGEHVLEMLEILIEKYTDGSEQVDPDSHVAFYGRMSLGPQQRYAVRGGTLQRYQAPDWQNLVAASKRIVP